MAVLLRAALHRPTLWADIVDGQCRSLFWCYFVSRQCRRQCQAYVTHVATRQCWAVWRAAV